jgi:hypothetical protein
MTIWLKHGRPREPTAGPLRGVSAADNLVPWWINTVGLGRGEAGMASVSGDDGTPSGFTPQVPAPTASQHCSRACHPAGTPVIHLAFVSRSPNAMAACHRKSTVCYCADFTSARPRRLRLRNGNVRNSWRERGLSHPLGMLAPISIRKPGGGVCPRRKGGLPHERPRAHEALFHDVHICPHGRPVGCCSPAGKRILLRRPELIRRAAPPQRCRTVGSKR